MNRSGRAMRFLTAAAVGVLAAACREDNRRVDAPPPASLAELEAAADLPYAEPAQVSYYAPERGYQWAERAYGLQRTFYDTPPDYGFDYDGEQPYVWETADDWALYAEPWGGEYRYYYYEPGAAHPYFVRDRDYGYAYSPVGQLIAMFYPDGRYVPADVAHRVAPVAGRYYVRGRDLRRVALRAERLRVEDRVLRVEQPKLLRSADPWLRAARDDGGWRKWREKDGDRELRRFEAETRKRQAAGVAWRDRVHRQQEAAIERRTERMDAQAARRALRDDRQDQRRELREVEQAQHRGVAEQRREARTPADRTAELRRNMQARSLEQEKAQQRAQAEAQAQRVEGERRRRQAQAERHVDPTGTQHARSERAQAQEARAPAAGERGKPAATREGGGKAKAVEKGAQEKSGQDKDRGRGRDR